MVITKDKFQFITHWLNLLKMDNPIRFYSNDDKKMCLSYTDKFSYFTIESDIEWNFMCSSFYVTFPNLSFIDEDININVDDSEKVIYINNDTVGIKLLFEDNLYDEFMEFNKDLKEVDISENYTYYVDFFKRILKSVVLNEDDFTSGIYADKDNLFGTDRILATWYKVETDFNDINGIVIDGKFFNLFFKAEEYIADNISFIYSNSKIGFKFTYNGFTITYIKSTLSYNYPNFKNVFSKMEYTSTIKIDKSFFMEKLQSILKFYPKCDRIIININDNNGLNIFAKTYDNVQSIEFFIPIEYITEVFEKYEFALDPVLLLKSISDSEEVYIEFNPEKNHPIRISDGTDMERYLRVYSV